MGGILNIFMIKLSENGPFPLSFINVVQAFDNQDNLFIMISNGLKPNNTKGNKVKLDENKIAEIIVATVQPMLDKALEPINKRLDNIEKDISELKSDVSELKSDVSDIKKRLSVLEREAIKHGWDLSEDKQ